MYAHNNFKQQLAARYAELLRARTTTPSDLSSLINSLFELVSSNSWNESRLVSEKILRLLEEGSKDQRLVLGDNQCAFLLHVLSLKGDFSRTEINLRSQILERVVAQLSTFKLEDLVKIAISLNKMEIIDFKNSDLGRLKLILNKVFDNITDLDEKSVFELIRGDHVCKYPGYARIYEEILSNIFGEIQDNGETRIGEEVVLKVFAYLSAKVDISRYDSPRRAKLFAILERSAANAAKSDNPRLFALRMEDFVKNGFFQQSQRPQVVALLAKNKLPTTMKLLYYFAIRGYSIEPFWEEVKEYKTEEMKHGNLARLAIILKKYEAGHPEAAALLAEVEARFSEHYSSPEKFVQFYRELKREKNQISLLHFSEALPNLGGKLPNPYETNSEDLAYRASFLDYVAETYRSRDYSNFLSKHDAQIKKEEVVKLVKDHLYESRDSLEPQKQLIYLLLKRLPDIVSSKDKKGVEVINELLTKYNPAVVHSAIDPSALTGLYRLLHTMIRRMKDLEEMGLNYLFSNVLEKYLTRNYRNYNLEQNYRNLLRHVLNNLEYFTAAPNKSRIATVAVQEALRLNILTTKMLEKVTVEKFNLPYYDRQRFEFVKDHSFKPTIDKLNFSSLKIVLSNPNLGDYIVQHEAQITELLTKSNNNELFNALVIFNQTKNAATIKLYKEILALVVERITNFDRLDIVGYSRNTLDRGLFNLYGHRQIVTKIMDYLRVRIPSLSLESHIEFLKFVNSQPTINPKEYYAALLEYVEKREDETAKESLLMKLTQTSYIFREEDVKSLESITSKNVFQGLSFFIAVEQLLTPPQRSQHVVKLVEGLTKATTKAEGEEKSEEEEFFVSKFNYQYLKKTYPAETAALDIPEASLHIYKFSIKPRFTTVYVTPPPLRKTSPTPSPPRWKPSTNSGRRTTSSKSSRS